MVVVQVIGAGTVVGFLAWRVVCKITSIIGTVNSDKVRGLRIAVAVRHWDTACFCDTRPQLTSGTFLLWLIPPYHGIHAPIQLPTRSTPHDKPVVKTEH